MCSQHFEQAPLILGPNPKDDELMRKTLGATAEGVSRGLGFTQNQNSAQTRRTCSSGWRWATSTAISYLM